MGLPTIAQAMQLVNQQEEDVENVRAQSERCLAAAREAYLKALEKDAQVRAVCRRNDERLMARRTQLNMLCGSKRVRPSEEVRRWLEPVGLEVPERIEDVASEKRDASSQGEASRASQASQAQRTEESSRRGSLFRKTRGTGRRARAKSYTGMFGRNVAMTASGRVREAGREIDSSSGDSHCNIPAVLREKRRSLSIGSHISVVYTRKSKIDGGESTSKFDRLASKGASNQDFHIVGATKAKRRPVSLCSSESAGGKESGEASPKGSPQVMALDPKTGTDLEARVAQWRQNVQPDNQLDMELFGDLIDPMPGIDSAGIETAPIPTSEHSNNAEAEPAAPCDPEAQAATGKRSSSPGLFVSPSPEPGQSLEPANTSQPSRASKEQSRQSPEAHGRRKSKKRKRRAWEKTPH